MPYFKHKHNQPLVFDSANGPVVADAITPQFTLVALQRFSQRPRIFSGGYAIAKEI
jgi:hypothetical protein